jgi:hypothetical protein
VAVLAVVGIGRQQPQRRARRVLGTLVQHALVGPDEGRQLGQQHLADAHQVALALEHAGEARQIGLQPVLLVVALGGQAQVVNHRVDVVFELGHLASRFHLHGARQVALGHGSRHLGNGAHLAGQVRRQHVHVARQVLPRTGRAGHVGLTAQATFHADLARNRRHLLGERRQRAGHVVDGVGERRDFALGFDGEVLLQVAVGDGGHDLGDAAHLLGQVRTHHVDGVGQILPSSSDARHLGLTTQLAVGANLARNARHLAGEGVELIDHRVDGVLQLQNLAPGVDGDLT